MRFLREFLALIAFAILMSCAAIQGLGKYENVECVTGCEDASADDAAPDDAARDDDGAPIVDAAPGDVLPTSFTVGGSVVGLSGTGLVLRINGGGDLPVTGTSFTFAGSRASGSTYDVTVAAQPKSPAQTCTIKGGSGIVSGANVTSVAVTCGLDGYKVGGTISGLSGSGLVLRNNGGDDLPVTGNGSFVFTNGLLDAASYAVTVFAQPSAPTQTCTVTAGAGSISAANVTTVAITCATNSYKVGGTVVGLSGSGLVLRNNGGANLAVSANSFEFPTPVLSGGAYSVTAFAQPTSPTQTCTVAMGAGTVGGADVKSVVVTCVTEVHTVSVVVTGLLGSGLVMRNNGGNNLAIPANGIFAFSTPVASGQPYAVTVFTSPAAPTQSCAVIGGSGTVGSANISVTVTCAATPACAALVTTASVWGGASRGIDLGAFTNGTLDWIGCASNGCSPATFFCTDEANGIFFGTTTGTLRALIDPGNAAGAAYPTSGASCANATTPRGICNAPVSTNNGVGGLNSGDALCKAMGFSSGVLVIETTNNSCPKPHSTTANGSNWTSTFANVAGEGQQYRCTR